MLDGITNGVYMAVRNRGYCSTAGLFSSVLETLDWLAVPIQGDSSYAVMDIHFESLA